MAALEQRIADEFDMSSFVSEAEASLFARLVPDRSGQIRGVSSGVDHRYFDPALAHTPVFDTRLPTYVFTGTMDYPPNVDAVVWFATEILPVIRRTVPAAQFYIVGNGPSAEVRRLAQIDGVFVTGRVPDVRPYIAHATARGGADAHRTRHPEQSAGGDVPGKGGRPDLGRIGRDRGGARHGCYSGGQRRKLCRRLLSVGDDCATGWRSAPRLVPASCATTTGPLGCAGSTTCCVRERRPV